MVELAVATGLGLDWTENEYGDRVPALREEEDTWPPEGFLHRLRMLFASDELAAAGRRWQDERSGW